MFLFALVGLAPFTVANRHWQTALVVFFGLCTLGAIAGIGYIAYIRLGWVFIYYTEGHASTLFKSCFMAQNIFYYMTHVSVRLESLLKYREYLRIKQDIADIRNSVPPLDNQWINRAIFLVFAALVHTVYQWVSFADESSFRDNFVPYISFTFIYSRMAALTQFMKTVQFCDFVHSVTQLLEQVNDELQMLVHSEQGTRTQSRIGELRIIHLRISIVKDRIVDYFFYSIFILVLFSAFNVIQRLYVAYYFSYFFIFREAVTVQFREAGACVFYIFVSCLFCNVCYQEHCKTGRILSKLPAPITGRSATRAFTTQMLHAKFEFSVGNYFCVSFKEFIGFIALVVNYIVLLIQFDLDIDFMIDPEIFMWE